MKISNKIFSKQDIRNIVNYILQECNNANVAGDRPKISFSIAFDDNTSIQSDTIDIFNDGQDIDLKTAYSITIDLWCYENDKRVTCNIYRGNQHSVLYSKVEVSGNELNWVNGIFLRLDEIFKAVKPQENIIKKYNTLINIVYLVSLGYFTYTITSIIFNNVFKMLGIKTVQITLSNVVIFIAIMCIVLFIDWIISSIYNKMLILLEDLWKEIEFDFGPEHMNLDKVKRKYLITFVTIVALPFLISIICKIFGF
jgi:hypothetical protein